MTDPRDRYVVDDLLIDTGVRQVSRGGRVLDITGLSFDLLLALVRGAPNLVSMEALMDGVWRGLVVSPQTVTQRVKLVRQALGDSADNPRYVAGLRGRGYRLAAQVRPLGFDARTSIAVLPFANLTGEMGKEYLGDAIAEELIDALARVPGLRVPARTSSFSYRTRNTDVRRIADELAVATILEGSVRSAGPHIRVGARLVDARSGFQIWSNTYERQVEDLFALQEQLAAQIVRALGDYLGTRLPDPLERPPPTRDVDAYQLYLQGRMAARGTNETIRTAALLFDQAVARDPHFADPLAARAVLRAGSVLLGGQPSALLQSSRGDALRALELNPRLPEAHTALGVIEAVGAKWLEASASFHAALALAPASPFVRNLYNLTVLRPVGRLQQARLELEATYSLAPAEGFTAHELALTHSLLGNDAEAVRFAELAQALTSMQPHWDLLLVYARAAMRQGRYSEAAERVSGALPASLRDATMTVQSFYAALAVPDRRRAAEGAIRSLMPRLPGEGIDGRTQSFLVAALASIGAHDVAYELADRLLDAAGDVRGRIDWADLWTPELRAFRQDARFGALVERLGFTPYWQQHGFPDGY